MNEKQQIKLTLLHVGIGSLMAFYPQFSKLYVILVVLTSFYYVIKNKNKNNEILYAIAYIAGSEVFFRTANGNIFYEAGKYLMLVFTGLGFYYSGLPKIRNPYWVYLLLLMPAVFVSFASLDSDLRRKITFEILGPVCIGFLALYNYKRSISAKEINYVLNLIALPILASCVYLILRFSHNLEKIDSDNSNFYFSGDYAPNQMATALGLGVFIYLLKIVLETDNRKMFYANILIFTLIFYRGLLTFSRGGVATGLTVVLAFLLAITISRVNSHKAMRKIGLMLLIVMTVFIIADYQTENSLVARYTKFEILNSNDVVKTRGRYIQIESDLRNFKENPILGIGVGKGKEVRKIEHGRGISTHSEITRLPSEHGIFGFAALLILLYYPLQMYFKNLKNYYILPFFIFWLLTINHSATRTIAPLFLYTLTLLQVKFDEKEPQ